MDLRGRTYRRAKIFRSPTGDFGSKTLLYYDRRYPHVSAGYRDRMKVTNVIDGDIITITFVIENVTLSDGMYYKMRVESKDEYEAENKVFLTVYGKSTLFYFFLKTKYSTFLLA